MSTVDQQDIVEHKASLNINEVEDLGGSSSGEDSEVEIDELILTENNQSVPEPHSWTPSVTDNRRSVDSGHTFRRAGSHATLQTRKVRKSIKIGNTTVRTLRSASALEPVKEENRTESQNINPKAEIEAPVPPVSSPVKKDDRLQIVEELWDTERSYVGDLEVIVNMYLIPLRDSLKNRESIISVTEIPKVFSNVETLLSVNSELLTLLDIILEKGIDPTQVDSILIGVSKAFIKISNHMKVYAEYCANNPQATEALNNVSKNPNYVAYEDLTRMSCNKIRLDGFIAKPVQRVLKYPLFFSQLLKSTNPEDLPYNHIKQALSILEGLAKYINEYKNQKENREKLQEIDQCLHGFKRKLYAPGRVYIREGVLMKISPKSKKPEQRKFYLFNDLLLYAKEKGGSSYLFKASFPTHLILVRDHPEKSDSFQLKKLDDKLHYTIICKSEFEKNEWMKDLRRVIEEQTSKQDPSSKVAKQLLLTEWQNSK